MKNITILLTLSFLFMFHNGSSQITYNKVKYYFGDSLYRSARIESIIKSDSFYFMSCLSYTSWIEYKLYIAKFDFYGNKVAEAPSFGNDSNVYIPNSGNSMIFDHDSNIVVVGADYDKQWGGFLIKLNQNMDTIFKKRYLFPDSLINFAYDTTRHMFEAIALTIDSNYIVMGNYYVSDIYTNENQRPYLIKIDKNGNVIWRKLYDNLNPTYDIATTNDGGFVFSAVRIGYYGLYVAKTDFTGNIEWYKKQLNVPYQNAYDITVSGNEIISIVPYLYFSIDNDPYSYLFGISITKTNSTTSQIIWSKKYKPLKSVENPVIHQHHEVEVDDNGNIFVVGTGIAVNSDSTAVSHKGFILKLNSNGDSLWSRFYDYGDFFQHDAQFNDFVITDDGGILAGGFWNPPYMDYKQGAWLVKTDSLGNAPGMFIVGVEENNLVIKRQQPLLYPNPTTDNINLSFEETPNEELELSIYSATGAIVKKQKLSSFENDYKINIDYLESGVYFIKIQSAEGVLFSNKFIKN